MLCDDADDELVDVVAGERRLGRRDRRLAIDERDRKVVAERRGLGVQDVDLVRLRRELDGLPELGLTLRTARQAELAGDRRPVVLEVDRDRDPRPEPSVTAEQDAGLHRQAVGGGDGAAAGPRAVAMSAKAATIQEAWRATGERRGMSG